MGLTIADKRMNQLRNKSFFSAFGLALIYLFLLITPKSLDIILIVTLPATLFLYGYLLGMRPHRREIFTRSQFFILPLLFNYGSIFFISDLLGSYLKVLVAIIAVIGNFYLLSALKRVYDRQERSALTQRNLVITIGFLTVFFSVATIFRFYTGTSADSDFSLPSSMVVMFVILVFYLVSYFLAWENGINLRKFMPYNLVISLLAGEVAWVSSLWVVNYPNFWNRAQSELGGVPLPAVTLTILFYVLWGVISHKADRNLNKNVLLQYFGIGILFLVILFLTARWLPDI